MIFEFRVENERKCLALRWRINYKSATSKQKHPVVKAAICTKALGELIERVKRRDSS